MNFERKNIELKDSTGQPVSFVYYDSGGGGQTLFCVGGLTAFPGSWRKIIELMPTAQYRFTALDLKGFGNSSKVTREELSPLHQASFIAQFILKLELNNIIFMAHSLGGTAALLALDMPGISSRADRLVLINSISAYSDQPYFIKRISALSDDNPILRFENEYVTAYLLLRQMYCHEEIISRKMLDEHAELFRQPGARECMIAAAQQTQIMTQEEFQRTLNSLSIPTLIIWGAEDRLAPKANAEYFQRNIAGSRIEFIPDCGHLPHRENPEAVVALIKKFIIERFEKIVIEKPKETKKVEPQLAATPPANYGLSMRNLIDRWSLTAIMIFIFVKILQLLKKMGLRAEENGWRKATGIFMRNEYSKFTLATFRLRYYEDNHVPSDFGSARHQLIGKLADFLRSNSSLHWSVEPGLFRLKRRKAYFSDIVEAFWEKDGRLERLEAHLDSSRKIFSILTETHIQKALNKLVKVYNRNLNVKQLKRPTVLSRRMRRWAIRGEKGIGFAGRLELRMLVDRLLTATFIHCEELSSDPERFLRRRLATPNIKTYRHPGWGLLNVICRFTPDYAEADLWVQYHHVPVDGMPMQELLRKLKDDWGSHGKLLYPAHGSREARPEMFYYGNLLFRARIYVNFEPMLAIRKHMNELYANQMGGPATIAGMLIWGLAQHPAFSKSKVVFPVELATKAQKERELSLVFIRPGEYIDIDNPVQGFINFQKDFNWRTWRTRMGRSESYELLELYSMIHPLFYYIARYVFPKTTGEILGTVGVTVIRDAEMFISPLSDLQQNGFMSIGNLAMPTVDGGTSGIVSICGDRKQIKLYIEAINLLADNYHSFIELSEETKN